MVTNSTLGPSVPQTPQPSASTKRAESGRFKVQSFRPNAKANTGNENCVCICVCS